jgi:hypothetical protein
MFQVMENKKRGGFPRRSRLRKPETKKPRTVTAQGGDSNSFSGTLCARDPTGYPAREVCVTAILFHAPSILPLGHHA